MARRVIGRGVVALTAESPIHPQQEIQHARRMAKELGVRHILLKSREMSDPEFIANGRDRCYLCKRLLFADACKQAQALGITHVAHGANLDDRQDFRPGFRAAAEWGVVAPLLEAGLTKDDIRRLARHMQLANWNRPAGACLASRVPYGQALTTAIMHKVARAEAVLHDLGFDACRVRHHDTVARIEVPVQELPHLLDGTLRLKIVEGLRASGYDHVALDLEGYRQGSLNRGVTLRPRVDRNKG
jgi:uncharacterized protein